MILWVLLFVLIVAISFVLALKSMVDFHEIPVSSGEDYGLFLIRRPHELTEELLQSIHSNLLASSLIISFERLIKGNKAALVVYGPEKILTNYKHALELVELEDYTNISKDQFALWEVAVKSVGKPDFPPISADDQIWWQLILSAKERNFFHPHIRLVVVSGDRQRRENLKIALQNLSPDKFIKLPKAFSDSQLLDFYKKRGFRKDIKNRNLNLTDVVGLLRV